jgi:hypothetical protein
MKEYKFGDLLKSEMKDDQFRKEYEQLEEEFYISGGSYQIKTGTEFVTKRFGKNCGYIATGNCKA